MKRVALCLILCALAPSVSAEIPSWMTGEWRTNARLTAPDGAQLRIRCTMNASAQSSDRWLGVLGCATVQGRFESRWNVTTNGNAATGRVQFQGTEAPDLNVSGQSTSSAMSLSSPDGQGVRFSPGANGAIVVRMDALGPQRLTGELTFDPR